MKWLIFLLLIPVAYGTCERLGDEIQCEVEFTINILENNTQPEFTGFEDDVYISKQRFLGNFVFILITIAAMIFAFISLVKT